jgi:hypothetical protein
MLASITNNNDAEKGMEKMYRQRSLGRGWDGQTVGQYGLVANNR